MPADPLWRTTHCPRDNNDTAAKDKTRKNNLDNEKVYLIFKIYLKQAYKVNPIYPQGYRNGCGGK